MSQSSRLLPCRQFPEPAGQEIPPFGIWYIKREKKNNRKTTALSMHKPTIKKFMRQNIYHCVSRLLTPNFSFSQNICPILRVTSLCSAGEGNARRKEKGQALGPQDRKRGQGEDVRKGGFSLPPQHSQCLPLLPPPGISFACPARS